MNDSKQDLILDQVYNESQYAKWRKEEVLHDFWNQDKDLQDVLASVNVTDFEKKTVYRMLDTLQYSAKISLENFLCIFWNQKCGIETVCSLVEKFNGQLWKVDYNKYDRLMVYQGWTCGEELSNKLRSYKYPFPMLVKPRIISGFNSSPWLTKAKEEIITHGQKGAYVPYDVFNMLNSVALTLNEEMCEHGKNAWGDDDPICGEELTYIKTQQSLDEYNRTSLAVKRALYGYPIWIPWFGDYRVRMYQRGHWIKIQGTDHDKSCIDFYKKIVCTIAGINALKCDIANNFGMSKNTTAEKLRWVNAHFNELKHLKDQAKDPNEYMASVNVLQDAINLLPIARIVKVDASSSFLQQMGIATGDIKACEMCNVLNWTEDGRVICNNSYMDVVYGCENLAAFIRKDPEMFKRWEEIILDYESMHPKYKQQKKAFMGWAYSSKKLPEIAYGHKGVAIFYEVCRRMVPIVYNAVSLFQKIWDKNWEVIGWDMPDGAEVRFKPKVTVNATYSVLGYTGEVSKTMYGKSDKPGRMLGANFAHSCDAYVLREVVRYCRFNPKKIRWIKSWINNPIIECASYHTASSKNLKRLVDLYKETGILSARIFHYLTPGNIGMLKNDIHFVKEMLSYFPDEQIDIVTIHDSFGVHPNYVATIKKLYRYQLVWMARGRLLDHVLGSLLGYMVHVFRNSYTEKNYKLLEKRIAEEATYALA